MTRYNLQKMIIYRLISVLLLAALRKETQAFSSIHRLHGPASNIKYTERMYGDRKGPWGIGGRSTITVNTTAVPLHRNEVSDTITIHRLHDYFEFGVAVATFTDIEELTDLDEHSICARNFSDPLEGNRDGVLYGEFHPIAPNEKIQISTVFHPKLSGLQVVLITACWKQKSESFGYPVSTTEFVMYPMFDPLLCVNGSVSFENPYGYLPALLFGLFPFNGILSFLYGFVDLCFVALINRYRKEALRVQYFVLVVLLLATGESFSWFVTYKFLNESGQSVCCPYPSLIILSTVIKIMAGMIARVMTTLICLGYGTVRPRITWPEVLVVSGLGLCYFISVGALEINHIITKSHGHMKPPVVWEFLVVVTNICFGGWIFTSLAMTCKNLETYGQVAKLKMYTSLKKVLIAYVLLSFLLMATEGAVYSGVILLDWKWIWTIWAANRLLMFAILLFVAFMWRPRGTSLLYSQMEQIPSEEVPPTPCSTDVGSHEMGIEMVRRIPMPLPPPSAHDERGAASPVSKRNISLLSHPETSSL